MAFRRYGTFRGGIDLPDEKHATLAAPIAPCRGIERLRVPLRPCGGAPAEPRASAGQRVRAGQRIASAPDETGVDIFAPLDGRVEALGTALVAVSDGFVESPVIELADLSEPSVPEPARQDAPQGDQAAFDWSAADPEDLLERLAAGGLLTYRRSPTPLVRWIAGARDRRCRTLIANAVEHEPYVTADHRVLAEYGQEVMEGLAVLARAIGAADVVLAADRRRTPCYEGSVDAAEGLGVSRIALPHKYPVGADTILTKVLTRRETPPGAGTTAVGAAVVDVATCLAVWHWVARGERPLGRVLTLAGPRAAEPANVWAPFGADCRRLAGGGDALVLHGGPMAGMPCPDAAVVTPATCAVLSLEADRPPLPSPCIRCGWCTDHCPAGLNVAALNDAFELSLVERARRAGAPACVECGVCSYVCPARLPLAHRVKQLKRRILAAARPAVAVAVAQPT